MEIKRSKRTKEEFVLEITIGKNKTQIGFMEMMFYFLIFPLGILSFVYMTYPYGILLLIFILGSFIYMIYEWSKQEPSK